MGLFIVSILILAAMHSAIGNDELDDLVNKILEEVHQQGRDNNLPFPYRVKVGTLEAGKLLVCTAQAGRSNKHKAVCDILARSGSSSDGTVGVSDENLSDLSSGPQSPPSGPSPRK